MIILAQLSQRLFTCLTHYGSVHNVHAGNVVLPKYNSTFCNTLRRVLHFICKSNVVKVIRFPSSSFKCVHQHILSLYRILNVKYSKDKIFLGKCLVVRRQLFPQFLISQVFFMQCNALGHIFQEFSRGFSTLKLILD